MTVPAEPTPACCGHCWKRIPAWPARGRGKSKTSYAWGAAVPSAVLARVHAPTPSGRWRYCTNTTPPGSSRCCRDRMRPRPGRRRGCAEPVGPKGQAGVVRGGGWNAQLHCHQTDSVVLVGLEVVGKSMMMRYQPSTTNEISISRLGFPISFAHRTIYIFLSLLLRRSSFSSITITSAARNSRLFIARVRHQAVLCLC